MNPAATRQLAAEPAGIRDGRGGLGALRERVPPYSSITCSGSRTRKEATKPPGFTLAGTAVWIAVAGGLWAARGHASRKASGEVRCRVLQLPGAAHRARDRGQRHRRCAAGPWRTSPGRLPVSRTERRCGRIRPCRGTPSSDESASPAPRHPAMPRPDTIPGTVASRTSSRGFASRSPNRPGTAC